MTDQSNQPDPPDSPPALQTVDGRDVYGRFAPGNRLGRPFPPGVSGNPSGRPEGVTYPGDWIRGLSCCTKAELHQVAEDPDTPISRCAAARMLLDTIDDNPEVRGRALIRVMDRTEGKPGVTVNLNASTDTPRSDDIKAELAKLIQKNPELRALVAEVVTGPKALPSAP